MYKEKINNIEEKIRMTEEQLLTLAPGYKSQVSSSEETEDKISEVKTRPKEIDELNFSQTEENDVNSKSKDYLTKVHQPLQFISSNNIKKSKWQNFYAAHNKILDTVENAKISLQDMPKESLSLVNNLIKAGVLQEAELRAMNYEQITKLLQKDIYNLLIEKEITLKFALNLNDKQTNELINNYSPAIIEKITLEQNNSILNTKTIEHKKSITDQLQSEVETPSTLRR